MKRRHLHMVVDAKPQELSPHIKLVASVCLQVLVLRLIGIDDTSDIAFLSVLLFWKLKAIQTAEILILAHDIDATSVLRYFKLMGREQCFHDLVSARLESLLDSLPGITLIMTFQIGHILKEDISWTMSIYDVANVIKQVATVFVVIKSQSLASLAERLTGKSSTQDVMVRNIARGDCCYVALYLVDATIGLAIHLWEIDGIEPAQVFT